MSLEGKYALVTGSSRGIALKLAEQGAKVAIHYYRNEGCARDTLAQLRERDSDGLVIQADVSQPDEVRHMVRRVADEFGGLDIFVANARPELSTFYQPPLDITLESWRMAIDSQATAFLVGVQEAIRFMNPGARIVAITYAPSAPHRELAAVGRDGRGEGSARGTGALLCGRAGQSRHHRQRGQPWANLGPRPERA